MYMRSFFLFLFLFIWIVMLFGKLFFSLGPYRGREGIAECKMFLLMHLQQRDAFAIACMLDGIKY